MKEKIGAVAFFLGLFTAMGCAGAITELPPEGTVNDIVALVGCGLTAIMLMQLGIWMINGEI
jgi:hypothetical protein